jgi:hypothetical protein
MKSFPEHQIVGEIADSGTTGLTTGARVGVSWIGGVDGSCWYCQHGIEKPLRRPYLYRLQPECMAAIGQPWHRVIFFPFTFMPSYTKNGALPRL